MYIYPCINLDHVHIPIHWPESCTYTHHTPVLYVYMPKMCPLISRVMCPYPDAHMGACNVININDWANRLGLERGTPVINGRAWKRGGEASYIYIYILVMRSSIGIGKYRLILMVSVSPQVLVSQHPISTACLWESGYFDIEFW